MAASDGNISERLKSVDILERFKAVIFQSGGSLCYAGWLAAPSPRFCVYLSILLSQNLKTYILNWSYATEHLRNGDISTGCWLLRN